ncbi:MAG: YezD family protein [Candidatus Omnitrophota bacterium]
MSIKPKVTKNIVNDAIIKEISDAVETLSFGTVTVKVHDKKITQVEVAEKKRFDDVWKIEEGGGI